MTASHVGFLLVIQLLGLAMFLAFIVALVTVNARRKERQAFYLSEMIKKIGDASGSSAMDFLREHERMKRRNAREAMTVAGLVGSLMALGLMIFLHGTDIPGVYRVGLIPLLPSLGLLIYGRLLAPRE